MIRVRNAFAKSVCVLGLVACFGCHLGGPQPTTGKLPQSERTLLATIHVEPEHEVEFYEIEPGVLAVREVGRFERARQLVRQEQVLDKPLVDLYRSLAPSANAVPEALRAADERASRLRAQEPRSEEPRNRQRAESRSGQSRERRSFYGDFVNYDLDAQWFKNNFCTGRQFADCYANVGWAGSTRQATFYQVTGMNASFDGSTHYWGSYRKCGFWGEAWGDCSWKTAWNEWISPRYFSTWTWNTSKFGWRDAHIDGSHVHFGARYDGGGGTPAPTVTCGQHNQLACNGVSCAPGLTLFENACWACGVPGTPCCKPFDNSGQAGGVNGSCHAGFCGYPGGFCQ